VLVVDVVVCTGLGSLTTIGVVRLSGESSKASRVSYSESSNSASLSNWSVPILFSRNPGPDSALMVRPTSVRSISLGMAASPRWSAASVLTKVSK